MPETKDAAGQQPARGATTEPGTETLAGGRQRRRARGFTLLELMMALTALGILLAFAIGSYDRYRYKAQVHSAVGDMLTIAGKLQEYANENRGFPDDLATVGMASFRDPWGRPYQYLNLQTQRGNGQARKRKNLSPLNSDYDLYSMGKNGASQSTLMAPVSRDDVVRASDGRFMGLAEDFDP